MADFSIVLIVLCLFLFLLNENFVVSSSVSLSPENANKFQRRSVVVKKKKNNVLIAMKPTQAATNYYPRYYPVSPIQFYPVPIPIMYRPMIRPQYRPRRPPPSSPPIVEVIDEVTPFYNFIQRHIIPSYMKDFTRIAAMTKKTIYHYHHDEDEPNEPKQKRKPKPKNSPKYHNIPPNAPKPMIYSDDPYDSFYYQPQKVKKSKRPTVKLHPEEYNAAILEAFDPSWEEFSANPSTFSRNLKSNLSSDSDSLSRYLPTDSNEDNSESAEETQYTYKWIHPTSTTSRPKTTLVTSSRPTTAPSLFFRATDDYLNPIYQHLPLITQDLRNNKQSTIGLPGQNRSKLLYLPVPRQKSYLSSIKKQIPTPLALTLNDDDKSMLYPAILTTSTTTTTTTSTTTTKKPIIDQTFRPFKPVIKTKTTLKNNGWKVVPTKKKLKDLDASASTFRKPLQVVRPLPKNFYKLPFNGDHYLKAVKSQRGNTASNFVSPTPSMAVTVGTMMDFNHNSQQNSDSNSDFFPGIVIDESVGMTTDPDVFKINAPSSKLKKIEQKTKLSSKFPLQTATKTSTSTWKPVQPTESYLKPKNLGKPFQFDLPNSANSKRQLALRGKTSHKSISPETKEDIEKLHQVFDELDRVASQKSKKIKKQTTLTEVPKQKISTTKVSLKENNMSKKADKPAEVRKFCSGRETGYYADVDNDCKNYYYCTKFGIAKKFKCSLGTVFNEENKICDWPRNVECKI